MDRRSFASTIRNYWLWPAILLCGLAILALSPGGFAEKSKLLLHGLCAQTPSHTFNIGDQPLPFDARMTGIYTGVFGAMVYLVSRGRAFAQQLTSWPKLIVLAVFMASMALDGLNSLLTDLGLWHPWTTTNSTRLVTGYLAGTSISVALVWLLSGTIFQVADRKPILTSWADFVGMLVFLPAFSLLMWLDISWMYVPIAALLVLSAWCVLGILALTTLLLTTRLDERVVRRAQIHLPGAVGLALGLGAMLLLSYGRQWLESFMGISTTL